MNILLRERSRKKLVSLILVLFVFSACTQTRERIVVTPKKPMYERPDGETGQGRLTPAKGLVATGIAHFKDKKFDLAEWKFEEAINLDPDYGPAYYWLARTRHKFHELQKALSLLDRAQGLLKTSEVWLERIERFRTYLLEKL